MRALWRDQRGSMSITMVGVLFLLMALCALFIDMGSLYLTRERLQGAVDSAALKAVSDRDNAQPLAAAIVSSNMPTDSPTIWVERGRYPPTGYTLATMSALPVADRFEVAASNANALRVGARAQAPLYFAGLFGVTDGWVSAQAIALNQPVTQIMASTQFADLSTLPANIPNALLSSLTGTPVSLTSPNYQTLSDSSVDILQLLDALITAAGLDNGDYEDILATPVTPGEILEAAAVAMASDPTQTTIAAQATLALTTLEAQWTGLGALTLDELLALDPQSPKASSGARLDLFNLALGAALTLNEQGGIVSQASLSIGGATASLYVSVVSPPRYSAIGGVGIRVETAQVRLFLDTRVVNAITIPLLGVSADVSLPLYVTQGQGEAEVTGIECASPDTATASVYVDATPGLASAAIGSVSPAALNGSVPPPVSPAGLVNISLGLVQISVTASAATSISGSTRSLTFQTPFTADNYQAVPLASPTDSLTADLWAGVTPGVSVTGLSPIVAGLLTPQLGPLVSGVVTPLAPLVDQTVQDLQSLFSLDRGYMTVADTFLRCGHPLLAQ